MAAGKVFCTSCGRACGRVYTAPGLADTAELCLECLEEWSGLSSERRDLDSMEDVEGPYFWNR